MNQDQVTRVTFRDESSDDKDVKFFPHSFSPPRKNGKKRTLTSRTC